MRYTNEDWTDVPEGQARAADPAAAEVVTTADAASGDGRSPWFWLRTHEGDLMLACFPQGDTYFAVELDFAR